MKNLNKPTIRAASGIRQSTAPIQPLPNQSAPNTSKNLVDGLPRQHVDKDRCDNSGPSGYIPKALSKLESALGRNATGRAAALAGGAALIPVAMVGVQAPAEDPTDNVYLDIDEPGAMVTDLLGVRSAFAEPKADDTVAAPSHVGVDPALLAETPDGGQLEAWKKTTKSNGAAAGTIKAAVDCYGKSGLFKKIVKVEDFGYHVTLQDNSKVEVSFDQLKAATESSKFEEVGEGNDVDFANFAFSVMAKRAQAVTGASGYSAALDDLNSGEWPKKCARYLGIPSQQIETLDSGALGQHGSVVAWGRSAVMVDHRAGADGEVGGHVYDGGGVAKSFDKQAFPDAMRFVSHQEIADKRARLSESLKDALERHSGVAPELITPTEDDSEITAWRQTNTGNCASVATIKAAVDCYGKANVFDKITKNDDGNYDVILQNGRTVHVKSSEIDTVSRSSRFKEKGSGDDIRFSNFAFTVMAKENMRISGFRSLSSAVRDLNDGEYPPSCAKCLGIPSKQIEHLTNKSKADKDSIVAWNSAHAVMVDEVETNGRARHLYDSYGTPKDYTGRRYPSAFRFIPPVPE